MVLLLFLFLFLLLLLLLFLLLLLLLFLLLFLFVLCLRWFVLDLRRVVLDLRWFVLCLRNIPCLAFRCCCTSFLDSLLMWLELWFLPLVVRHPIRFVMYCIIIYNYILICTLYHLHCD